MNTTQKLRRLQQKMGNSGWNGALNIQGYQLKLINKVYLKNGLELRLTSFACPEQYDVFKDGKQVAYYRLRHGYFTVEFPKCGGELIYETQPTGDGIFDITERASYLLQAMRLVLLQLKQSKENG